MTTTVSGGLGSTFGFVSEGGTYGTNTTVTKWWEVDDQKLKFQPVRWEGKGLAGGQLVQTEQQRVTTNQDAAGQVSGQVFQKGMGRLLGAAMGSTAVPVQIGSSAAYTQTHNLAKLLNISHTCQSGIPNALGVISPYTFTGGKIVGFTFEGTQGAPVKATFDFDFQNATEATGYAAASFIASNPPLHFGETAISLGAYGAEAAVEGVTKWTVTGKRAMADKRFYADGTGLKAEPVENDFIDIEVSFDIDFITKADFVDRFVADTSTSIQITALGPVIASTDHYFFKFNIPAVHFNAETPTVDGPGLISPKVTGKMFYDETHTAATLLYQSTDTSL